MKITHENRKFVKNEQWVKKMAQQSTPNLAKRYWSKLRLTANDAKCMCLTTLYLSTVDGRHACGYLRIQICFFDGKSMNVIVVAVAESSQQPRWTLIHILRKITKEIIHTSIQK